MSRFSPILGKTERGAQSSSHFTTEDQRFAKVTRENRESRAGRFKSDAKGGKGSAMLSSRTSASMFPSINTIDLHGIRAFCPGAFAQSDFVSGE